MGVCNLVAGLFWKPSLGLGGVWVAYGLLCVVRCVFVVEECLLMSGVSDDRCIGFSFVRWLFGGCMVGLLVVLFVPLLLSFLAMPGLCCLLCVTPKPCACLGCWICYHQK